MPLIVCVIRLESYARSIQPSPLGTAIEAPPFRSFQTAGAFSCRPTPTFSIASNCATSPSCT